jgi:DNA (cytosine-5)-methyltransferase 1
MAAKRGLTVADFFCGAGGFSEGFRQKGFDVVFSLDNWAPAKQTHDLNHPHCRCELMDILELDTPAKIDAVVPDTDIIIGSPPCVSFSGSNKAGKADKSLGIALIKAYLRIVAWKLNKGKVKHWILENVPNSGLYIQDEYTWEELGLPGRGPTLKIKNKGVLNAADYGAPQTRKRFICGDYPTPKKTHEGSWITMTHVMETLSNPLDGSNSHKATDPIHGFSIPSSKLTDHFYDTRVAEYEWSRARRLKEDHGFMGKMSFPEELDRPSRTVMATMSASTRESMIFDAVKKGKKIGYRLPTIREIACFMGFPINYQFSGNNESTKYKQVGNAVCVPMSAALAEAILIEEKMKVPEYIMLPDIEAPFNLNGLTRRPKKPSPRRNESKFAVHVPYIKIRSFRVELDNLDSDFAKNELVWSCHLHQGTGERAFKRAIPQQAVTRLLENSSQFKAFKNDVHTSFSTRISADALQEEYCQNDDSIGPIAALDTMKKIVDKHFPEDGIGNQEIDNSERIINIEKDSIPLRILAALYACNHYVSMISNGVQQKKPLQQVLVVSSCE